MITALVRALAAVAALTVAAPVSQAFAEVQMIMVEQAGCVYCARWNREISPEYPLTPEGIAAPLRRIDKHAPLPGDLSLAGPTPFTPTFVLVRDGVELARMEGYAGEEFFWVLLGRMLEEHDVVFDPPGILPDATNGAAAGAAAELTDDCHCGIALAGRIGWGTAGQRIRGNNGPIGRRPPAGLGTDDMTSATTAFALGPTGHKAGLPVVDGRICDADLDRMMESATEASNFLKAISHEGRLMILCHLVTGEKSVTELEDLLSARQAAVSQQLARLRLEGLVTPRREGKAIFYSLTDSRSRQIIDLVYDMFCRTD